MKIWLYLVTHESNAVALLEGQVSARLEICSSFSSLVCSVGTVSVLVRVPGIDLCRWTRVKVRLKKKHVELVVGRFVGQENFKIAAEKRTAAFESIRFQNATEHAFWSFEKHCPSYPPNTNPTPKRSVGPIDSVEQLLRLAPSCVTAGERRKNPIDQKCLLVCHDFKGNYLPSDRCLDTVFGTSSKYSFIHWPLARFFVYFAHSRICIPPPSWVAACKTNSCALLGTLITEWQEGEKENVKLFSQPLQSAKALAQIAIDRGFDGWLINLESPCPPALLPNVHLFLRTLREYCTVIFYDSLTADTGRIEWQNTLNDRNAAWLESSDGFFTNYWWYPQMLPKAPDARVFVGTDV